MFAGSTGATIFPYGTDQPTTTVTVRVDGRSRTVDVYALNFNDGVTAAQRENRKRLSDFIELAGDPGALLPVVVPGSTRRYDSAAIAVFVSSSETTDGARHAWPLGALSGKECAVYEGGDAAAVLDAARTAREGDVWQSAGATYNVAFRPLLPDERTCDDVTGVSEGR